MQYTVWWVWWQLSITQQPARVTGSYAYGPVAPNKVKPSILLQVSSVDVKHPKHTAVNKIS